MKLTIILLLTLLFSNTSSAAYYAKVITIKGKASQLAPGMHFAKWLKKGQVLKEETSIVTREKSFIRMLPQ